MEPLALLALLHHLANAEELEIDRMHVHVLALVLLRAEVRLLEWRLEHITPVILDSVPGLNNNVVLLFELVSQLLRPIVKVLPYDIGGLLLLGGLESLLAFDDSDLLLLEGGLLPDEVEDILGSVLDHERKVIHPVLCDGSLFGVVLDCQHLAHDCLLKHFN